MNQVNTLAQIVKEDECNRKNIKVKFLEYFKEDPIGCKAFIVLKEAIKKIFQLDENLDLTFVLDEEEMTFILLMSVFKKEGSKSMQGLIAAMMPMFETLELDVSTERKLELATQVIILGSLSKLYELKQTDKGNWVINPKFQISNKLSQYIASTMYLPPMIVKPQQVKNNMDCAYLTIERESMILKNNHHNGCISLDVVNILNAIPLSLDEYVISKEEMPTVDEDTTIDTLKQFYYLREASKEIYAWVMGYGNKMYLTWKPDKRGRFYSQGYHVNMQANEYRKASINLHEKLIIPMDK